MPNEKKTSDFGIDFVLKVDLPDIPKKVRGSGMDIQCPFCGRKGKMHVDIAKNVYRCNACSSVDERASGGMLKLHRLLAGLEDDKADARDLHNRFDNLAPAEKSAEIQQKEMILESAFTLRPPLPVEIRDLFFKTFLSLLELEEVDRKDLKRRGLTDEDIEKGMYKSTPRRKKAVELAVQTIQLIDTRPSAVSDWAKSAEHGSGIPGLYFKNGMPHIAFSGAGYFVPILNKDGLISAMQIRLRNPKGKQKYIYLSSSNEKTGCAVTGTELIHFAGFRKDSVPKVVWLTEGPLKADIASKYSGRPVIALIGVNNTSQLPETFSYLKARGTQSIGIAIDMDRQTNKNVEKAYKNILKIAENSGFELEDSRRVASATIASGGCVCIPLKWSSEYKGIDDYLLATVSKKK